MKPIQTQSHADAIRALFADDKPRTLPDIRKTLPDINEKTISSVVTKLWREQKFLLASELKSIISLQQLAKNRFKWSRQKLRWYVVNTGQHTAKEVTYQVFDKRLGRNVEAKEILVFKEAAAVSSSQKTGASAKALEILTKSELAMFPEDFEAHGFTRQQATIALHSLYFSKKIQRLGWINPNTGEDGPFERGWLYFSSPQQAERRLQKKDFLSRLKQEIYDFISMRTRMQRSFTRAKAIMKKFDLFKYTKITELIEEINAVYKDIAKETINGETFYYLRGILADDEIAEQREFWKSMGIQRSSFHSVLGRAHEVFVQTAMDQMWDSNDFQIANYRWEFSLDKQGRKRYSKFFPRVSDCSKRWEFDRILHCHLAPFGDKGNNEIVLVFEMKYRGKLDVDHWEAFVHKLADTWGFGYEARVRDVQGNRFVARLKKHNVVPVIVVPWAGNQDIEVRMGKEMRKVSFAEYVAMQGGIVLFTGEFERYLKEKLGRSVNFIKMFKAWWAERGKSEVHEEEFTQLLLGYLLGKVGSNFEERALAVGRD